MRVWAITLFVCAIAWSFQFTSFLDAKGLVLTVGFIIAACLHIVSGHISEKGFRRFAPLWLGLLVYIISGFFTAHVLSFHIEKSLYLGMMLFIASLASPLFSLPQGRIWLLRSLLFSGATVGLLALLQYAGLIDFLLPQFPGYTQRAYSVFGNQNLLGGYMAMNLALLAAMLPHLRKLSSPKFFLYLIVLVLLLGALLLSGTRSAWLAAIIGCTWGVMQGGILHPLRMVKKYKKRIVSIIAVLVILVFLGAPLVQKRITATFSDTDIGGNSRIWFWTGAKHMISTSPLFGVGLGNYAYWSPLYQGKALEVKGQKTLYHNELHTVHAHSEPLEFLAETGLVGCIFLLWFLAAALRRNSIETTGLITLGIFSCINTISHSPPHLLAGLLLAGSAATTQYSKPKSFRKVPRLLIVVAVLLFSCSYTFTTLIPSILLNKAEQTHIAGGTPESLYMNALHWPWPNPQAHESYAIFLMDESRFNAAGIQLDQALKSLDTGRIHLLIAICAEAAGNRDAVQHHAQQCLYRWPGNKNAQSLIGKTLL